MQTIMMFLKPSLYATAYASTLFLVSQAIAEPTTAQFDAPAIVVAEPVNPAVIDAPLTGGKLVRLRIPITAFLQADTRLSDLTVEIRSPNQTLRVLDYWPRNETYTDFAGNIQVKESRQKNTKLNADASFSYASVGKAGLQANYQSQRNEEATFARKPPTQLLTASGTSNRGFGVFFKFRPGPTPHLEGSRDIAILAEVPRSWRADLLEVNAAVTAISNGRVNPIASRFWIAIHQEGDRAAAAKTRRFVKQEQALRTAATSYRSQIKERAMPTVFHKIGAAMDLMDPRIPDDFLMTLLFGQSLRFTDETSRLPVDFRVIVLDYWEARKSLNTLASIQ